MIAGLKKTLQQVEVIKIEKEECKESKRIKKEIEKGHAENEVSVPFSRFPMSKWGEWWTDCQKNYNGCRWFKAWSDHLRARNSAEYTELKCKIDEIEMKLDSLLSPPEEPERDNETVKTLGGVQHV